jgi:hypothetical protein
MGCERRAVPPQVLGDTLMCTLQDKSQDDKHRVVVAALAHLVVQRRPALGQQRALQHALRAYAACLQAAGPSGELAGHTTAWHVLARKGRVVCATWPSMPYVRLLVLVWEMDWGCQPSCSIAQHSPTTPVPVAPRCP